jgi:hypothetical protein
MTARRSNESGQTTCVPLGQVSISESAHSTGLAYGGGVQFLFRQLSARVEYEGLNWKLASEPHLASFVVTWKSSLTKQGFSSDLLCEDSWLLIHLLS